MTHTVDPSNMQRRVNINTSRRVSHLTNAEVQKKRAIDRDNQRHHRAKTKAYIKTLETQVAELTRQLQDAHSQLLERGDSPGSQKCSTTPGDLLSSSSISTLYDQESATDQDTPTVQYQSSSFNNPTELECEAHSLLNTLPLVLVPGITLSPLEVTQGFSRLELSLSNHIASDIGAKEQAGFHLGLEHNNDGTLSWDSMIDQQTLPDVPNWQLLPLHLPPSTKLDEVIVNTVNAWKSALQLGHQEAELSEATFPSISSLLNRGNEAQHLRPLSVVVADQVGRSPLTSVAERLGFMYILSHLIRWLVCRTKQTYDSLPDFLKPTHLQQTVPHPVWVDTITWPEARDCIIRGDMNWGDFDVFRELTGKSMSVGWPYSDSDAVLESGDGQLLTLNPVFVSHISNVNNWQVGLEVADRFPFMLPFCRI
ncbi:hypothetical protein FE257_000769 [Aspergillus nanangensis]|uniref:BZIP domain-containing protein n=1 Tax=Aspergillus nanangensis TaxID=2582783 RepID=A0AAD4CEZ0_ASPNN|nr:hypothetical protein FE257_000769 [Aspergillus nanangensis]